MCTAVLVPGATIAENTGTGLSLGSSSASVRQGTITGNGRNGMDLSDVVPEELTQPR